MRVEVPHAVFKAALLATLGEVIPINPSARGLELLSLQLLIAFFSKLLLAAISISLLKCLGVPLTMSLLIDSIICLF